MDASARPAGLPLGPLVGRERELTVLTRLLPDPGVRLLTLTGPPGVGKTRLALAAAAAVGPEFADVVLVDLTRLRDPGLVVPEVTAALAGAPSDGVLLLLDNAEHVLAAAPDLGRLLAARPGVTVLVTSRERLHLRAERELPVPPLALPGPAEVADPVLLGAIPAVALLVGQVRSFDPGFAVTTANRETLAEICLRLDGLPLALELAAPRLRLFSPAELLSLLRHRVGTLTADASDVPDRHRTLSAALAWSHDLLTDGERAVFRRLSVFVGGWTLAAAGAVCDVPDAVAATASLVDKSLLHRSGDGEVGRFGMLESLREFSAGQLQDAGETTATRERHAAFFTGLARDIEQRVGTGRERAAIEEVGRESGNLREALAFLLAAGRPAAALPVASALGWYCYTRGQLGAGQTALETAIAAAAGDPATAAEDMSAARLMVGTIALARGDVDGAAADLTRGLELNARVGSLRLAAIGTAFLGHVARARGDPATAVARHTEAGRMNARLGNDHGVAWSRYDLGLLARQRREPDRAAGLLREALRAFRGLRYDWAVACSAWALATVELGRGRADDAAVLLAEALECFAATGDDRGVAQCLEAAAGIACAADPVAAGELLGAAGALRSRLSAPVPEEERAAVEAVRRRLRQRLGTGPADDAESAGRAMPASAAVATAHRVLDRPAAVPAPRAAGDLTPRETEVAGLVRAGRTNRQIGRHLGISEKTTEVHVHNIIRKLGAGSRAEIAAWVAAGERSGS